MKFIGRYLSCLLFSVIFLSQSHAQNLSGGPKIKGPWLWFTTPTTLNDSTRLNGEAAVLSGIDFLSHASNGEVTEQKIAAEGASIGEPVGNKVWTPGVLPSRGYKNIQGMLRSIGLVKKNYISYHVAYGSILLNSPEEQDVIMLVGSDDGVKVWLNGELVHKNPVDRGAYDYQDLFLVTLKEGENVLLVAVYQGYGNWSGFFGFAKGTVYEVLPPKGFSYDVDGNGKVNTRDLLLVLRAITSKNLRNTNPRTDVNKDGVVNIADLLIVIDYLDDPVTGAAPPRQESIAAGDPKVIREALNRLHEQNDGSEKYERSIQFLQSMLAVSTPKGKLTTTWAGLKGESTIEE